MSFWYRLLRGLGFRVPVERTYLLDDELVQTLRSLAEQEKVSEAEVASGLISEAIARRLEMEDVWQRWQTLSPREQQVAAMVCQNYTTGEIAAHLVISGATVKSHIRHILVKFNVHSRNELRLVMADWDFRALGVDRD